MKNQVSNIRSDDLGKNPVVEIKLLGSFSIQINGKKIPPEAWRLRKVKNLVKLLALVPGHQMHRDQVIEYLWPDSDPKAAANLFYQALHAARRTLDPDGQLVQRFLTYREEQLLLCPEIPLWVDIDAFAKLAAVARKECHPIAYQRALDLYTGDLLPGDRYEEWAEPARKRLSDLHQELLYELAVLHHRQKNYSNAIELLNQIVALDDTCEEAHVLLMRLYAETGQRREALQQYQTLKNTLKNELGLEPLPETTSLFDDILHDRVAQAIRAESPGLPPRARHNLPSQLSSFIGRAREIDSVVQLLSANRLVTITGAGGTGKTRLALKAAEQVLDDYSHGVWWVELAPISDPALILKEVAEVLNVYGLPGHTLAESLEEILRSRRMLLVLDNCEHLIPGVSDLAARLLHSCPDLHILATSREILAVEGENCFYCPSLTLPHKNIQQEPGALEQSEAVRLFVERAKSAVPDFAVDAANANDIAVICHHLDGIPLAIELAAARTRMLSVDQIAARLDHAFSLLTSNTRSALPRHQTLKALIDWSYDLLSPPERVLFQHLSVFSGEWSLEAAEEVCGDAGGHQVSIRLDKAHLLELLGNLINKSLIRFEHPSNQESHYRMLETVRQYACERLAESGEEDGMRERLLDYYVSLAQQAEPHFRSWKAKQWFDRLDAEMDNVRLALTWSLARSVEKGMLLSTALFWFWWTRNHCPEGIGWLERLLENQHRHVDEFDSKIIRGRAINVLVYLQELEANITGVDLKRSELVHESHQIFQQLGGEYKRDQALSLLLLAETSEEIEACREAFLELHDLFWISECDQGLVNYANNARNNAEEIRFFAQECLDLRQEIGDIDGQGIAYLGLSWLEIGSGNISAGSDLIRKAIHCMETVGQYRYATRIKNALGNLYLHFGKVEDASLLLNDGFTAAHSLGDTHLLFDNLTFQGVMAWTKRRYSDATQYLEEAAALSRKFPIEIRMKPIYFLMRVALSQGQLQLARKFLNSMQDGVTVAYNQGKILLGLGLLAVREAHMEQAALWFGTFEGWKQKNPWAVSYPGAARFLSQMEKIENDQALEQVRQALGEEALQAAIESRRHLTEDEMISLLRDRLSELA
jgi:predicted ATPase/DNA-binding SARP family transcriptional activator